MPHYPPMSPSIPQYPPVAPSVSQYPPVNPSSVPVPPSTPQCPPVHPCVLVPPPVYPSVPQYTPVSPSTPSMSQYPQYTPVSPSTPQCIPISPEHNPVSPSTPQYPSVPPQPHLSPQPPMADRGSIAQLRLRQIWWGIPGGFQCGIPGGLLWGIPGGSLAPRELGGTPEPPGVGRAWGQQRDTEGVVPSSSPGGTGLYWDVLGHTGGYWGVLGDTGCTGTHWGVLEHTGRHWALDRAVPKAFLMPRVLWGSPGLLWWKWECSGRVWGEEIWGSHGSEETGPFLAPSRALIPVFCQRGVGTSIP